MDLAQKAPTIPAFFKLHAQKAGAGYLTMRGPVLQLRLSVERFSEKEGCAFARRLPSPAQSGKCPSVAPRGKHPRPEIPVLHGEDSGRFPLAGPEHLRLSQ